MARALTLAAKYAGNTHRWSSRREHCTRSSNSNKSCVAPRNRSGLAAADAVAALPQVSIRSAASDDVGFDGPPMPMC